MSLLLDALKKAAEQKAQKSKAEEPVDRFSDETLLDAGGGSATDERPARSDETEFDHPELNARLQRGHVVRGGGDETGLDIPDNTDTRAEYQQQARAGEDTGLELSDDTDTRVREDPTVPPFAEETELEIRDSTRTHVRADTPPADSREETALEVPDDSTDFRPSDQLLTGDDETIVFEEDEDEVVIAAVSEPGPGQTEDETDLSQIDDVGDDVTGVGAVDVAPGGEDETDLSLISDPEDLTGIGAEEAAATVEAVAEDETDLSRIDAREDETGIGVEEAVAPVEAAAEDETDLSRIDAREDETGIGGEEAVAHVETAAEDETDLSQLDARDDVTGIGAEDPVETHVVAGPDDETDLGQLGDDDADEDIGLELADEADLADDTGLEFSNDATREDDTGLQLADETGLEQAIADSEPPADDGLSLVDKEISDEEITDEGGADEAILGEEIVGEEITDEEIIGEEIIRDENVGEDTGLDEAAAGGDDIEGLALVDKEDQTDLRQAATSADQVEAATAEPAPERDADGMVSDEDLSLLLLEPDPTSPRAPGLAAASMLDITETRGETTDTESPTLTGPTGHSDQTRIAEDTHTTRAAETHNNLTRSEATSTRTYAPDNYDRTLMKLPSDDESRLFSGMKAESDVVMTPDYAKKVFQSKTSAQRAHNYKVYVGIGLVILVAISAYGIDQYHKESLRIDDSLRALKRDPMPGPIEIKQPEEASLFAGTDGDSTARTIEIIETAGGDTAESTATTTEAETPQAPATDESSEAVAAEAQPQEVAESEVAEVVISAPETTPVEVETIPPEPEPAEIAQVDPEPASAAQTAPQDSVEDAEVPDLIAKLDESPADEQSVVTQTSDNLHIESSNRLRNSDLWLRDAYSAYSAGNDAEARKLYNQVLEADPTNRNALLGRAAINVRNADIDAAIRDYQALLLANPKDSLAMSSLLAIANYSPSESETQLKLMMRDEPDSPHLNFALANAYGAQDRWPEAQRHYFRALQNNPDDPNYAYNLAVSLEHISQPASAASYYQRALDNLQNGTATFNPELVAQRLQVLEKP